MVLPIDLILVRHGESEGNIAMDRGKLGDTSIYKNEKFKMKHTSLYRLTTKGISQAKSSGEWIKKNVGILDKYYCSEYIRAMETAAYLDFKNANWKIDFMLRERDFGSREFENYKTQVRLRHDPKRKLNQFFYVPPCGESIAHVCTRLLTVINTLHSKCFDKKVIIVCHAEVIRAFRVLFERIGQHRFRKMMKVGGELKSIYNGHVFHYTRRDRDSGKLYKHFIMMRNVVPHDLSLVESKWRRMKELGKTKMSAEEMLKVVNSIPRVIDNDDSGLETFEIPEEYEEEDEGEGEGEEDEEEEEEGEIEIDVKDLKKSLVELEKSDKKMKEDDEVLKNLILKSMSPRKKKIKKKKDKQYSI